MTAPADILARARDQVLEQGVGLSEADVLDVLRLPDDGMRGAAAAGPRGADALVRPGGRGRGHHQSQDRRLPRGLSLLLPVRPVRLAGALGVAGRAQPGRSCPADRGQRRDRVLHRGRGAGPGPPSDEPGRRRGGRDPRGRGHQHRLLSRHADPGPGRRAGRALGVHRYNHNLETARSYFPQVVTTHTWRGAVEHVADGRRRGHAGVLRRHPRHGGEPGAAGRVRRAAGRRWTPTRCR